MFVVKWLKFFKFTSLYPSLMCICYLRPLKRSVQKGYMYILFVFVQGTHVLNMMASIDLLSTETIWQTFRSLRVGPMTLFLLPPILKPVSSAFQIRADWSIRPLLWRHSLNLVYHDRNKYLFSRSYIFEVGLLHFF